MGCSSPVVPLHSVSLIPYTISGVDVCGVYYPTQSWNEPESLQWRRSRGEGEREEPVTHVTALVQWPEELWYLIPPPSPSDPPCPPPPVKVPANCHDPHLHSNNRRGFNSSSCPMVVNSLAEIGIFFFFSFCPTSIIHSWQAREQIMLIVSH